MAVLKWLLLNWDSVVLIALVFVIIIYLIKTGQTKILKQIAVKLVTDAEGECGSGTGVIKLSEVVGKLYEKLPSVIRILFTEKQLVQITEKVLEEAKKKWETNENVSTYIENKKITTATAITVLGSVDEIMTAGEEKTE
ncbi:hypothetical protein [Bacteroides sp.]|uniref:hypothetical protein n=1 Tax=Bacteroides sp. TaxID=29523 RepID=UPI002602F359|nr:hypothetical protein [Bacteroides sp.]MDD3040521.1 hypothetical protein [Bacteroides sp.]